MEELLLFIDNPKDPIYHHFDSLEINTEKLDVINEKVKELIHNKDLQTSKAKDWLIKCRDVLVFDFKPYFQKWSPWGFADILKDEALEKVERTIERVEYAIKHFGEPVNNGDLWSNMSGIIKGVNQETFNYIIENKELPPRAAKGIWTGGRPEAWIFAKHFELAYAPFNRCFDMENGQKLHSHDKPRRDYKTSEMQTILGIP